MSSEAVAFSSAVKSGLLHILGGFKHKPCLVNKCLPPLIWRGAVTLPVIYDILIRPLIGAANSLVRGNLKIGHSTEHAGCGLNFGLRRHWCVSVTVQDNILKMVQEFALTVVNKIVFATSIKS